ncbi:MAG: hypothetical protein L0Y54_21760 [Sporichthyaceae bacterium]|nr:hypothetical protein [Sporichthyaceae bacterium]
MTDPARAIDDWLDALGTLWPGALVHADRQPEAPASRGFLVLPSARRPKLLIPVGARALAAAAADRTTAFDSLTRRLSRRGLGTLLRLGLGPAMFRDRVTVIPAADTESIEDHLAGLVGEPVRVAIAIGTARANRKPVLQVYTERGTEVGFAKVGTTMLANQLIRAEAGTLARLESQSLTALAVPRVRHHGRWHDHEVLLLDALPTRGRARRELPIAAMAAIAGVGTGTTSALADSPWFAALRDRTAGLGPDFAERFDDLAAALADRHGRTTLAHGCWHGDWGPWNMAWHQQLPQVWDWERFADGVPVGFDAAHFVAHPALAAIGQRDQAMAALAGPVAEAVARLIASPADSPACAAVVDAYLLEMACRFATDCGPDPADPVRQAATWRVELAELRLSPLGSGRHRRPDSAHTPTRRAG